MKALLSLALALSLGSITLPPAPQASAGAAMDAGATVELK